MAREADCAALTCAVAAEEGGSRTIDTHLHAHIKGGDGQVYHRGCYNGE